MTSLGADTLKEKYLTCLICDSLYEDPATLQCGHTYCRKCLTSLLKSRPDCARDKVIPCSMRCESTVVPNPNNPIDDWARQIRPSFTIRNLMDDFNQMTAADCKTSITTISKRQYQTKSSEEHTSQFSRCEKHKGELLKMVCETCRTTICSTCWGTKHQQCTTVVLLETKLKRIQQDVLNGKSKLKDDITAYNTNISKFQSMEKGIREMKTDIKSKIRAKFLKMYDVLQMKESSLLHEVDTLTDLEIQCNQEQIQSEKKGLEMHQQRLHLIEKAEKSGSLNDIYHIYQSCLSTEASEDETDTSKSAYRAVTDVVFNVKADQLIDSVNTPDFCTLDVTYETNTVDDDSSMLFISPVLAETETILCRLPDEKKVPSLRDITVLVVDEIQTVVVTDRNNNCVKAFYIRTNQKYHSSLWTDSYPYGITQLKMNQIMITVPQSRKIVTVAVNPNLVLLSTIATYKKYRSLAVLDQTRLAAGSYSWWSNCVDILNMEGQLMKSISTDNNVKLFSSPWYMCADDKGNLLVSDCWKKTVTCLMSDGEVLWIYAPTGDRKLKSPTGIKWTQDGILLVDEDYHKVVLLTKSGQYVRDVLTKQDGLIDPCGIFVDRDNSLFVCCGGEVKHLKVDGRA